MIPQVFDWSPAERSPLIRRGPYTSRQLFLIMLFFVLQIYMQGKGVHYSVRSELRTCTIVWVTYQHCTSHKSCRRERTEYEILPFYIYAYAWKWNYGHESGLKDLGVWGDTPYTYAPFHLFHPFPFSPSFVNHIRSSGFSDFNVRLPMSPTDASDALMRQSITASLDALLRSTLNPDLPS